MTGSAASSPRGSPTRTRSTRQRAHRTPRARRDRREDGDERRDNRRGRRQRPSPANTPGNSAQNPPDMRDSLLPPLLSIPGGVSAAVLRMRELFGPMLPDDITYADASPPNPALAGMAFTTSYDEGFCGHFTIPGGDGAAARFGDVAAKKDMLTFVRTHLEVRPDEYEDGGGQRELVVFAPGLNTLHMTKEGWENESTTPHRLRHYVRVLQQPLAQLHLGTDMDQGEVEITASPVLIGFIEANRAALESANVMPIIADGRAILEPRKRDSIETQLSSMGYARPLLQDSIVRLLRQNETERQPLVLMPYSRSTAEVSGGLRQYKAAFMTAYLEEHGAGAAAEGRDAVEEFLRETLTVVSIGNVDRNWPDGPAYVHFAAVSDRAEGGTDVLVRDRGVTAGAPEGAGADAVFVHTDGVFSGFDVHNFGVVGAPTLRLVMAMNGLGSFRELWEKGGDGALELPGLEEVAAAVVLVDGTEWLWRAETAYDGVTLPSREDAQTLLAKWW